MLRLSEANTISTVTEALLFGFSLLMFTLTLWILLRKRNKHRPNYLLLVSACVLQTMALAELINNVVRISRGLITVGPFIPGGPEVFFSDFTDITFVVKSCLYNAQTLILDGVVIYRTYLVWRKFYVVVLPVLGWFGLLAGSVGLNVSLVRARENISNVFIGVPSEWIRAVYSLTLATNLSASTLLAYRVWKVDREARKYKANNVLGPVVLAVIESGALYSAAVTVALVTFVINTPGVYIVLDSLSPIICIVFNMIIVRVAFASGKLLPSIISTKQRNTTAERPESRERRGARPYDSDGYQLGSLAIEVTRYVETDGGTGSITEVDQKSGRTVEYADDISPSKTSSSGSPV